MEESEKSRASSSSPSMGVDLKSKLDLVIEICIARNLSSFEHLKINKANIFLVVSTESN